jgi:hypothetical protein
VVIDGRLSRTDCSLEAWLGSLVKAIGWTNYAVCSARGLAERYFSVSDNPCRFNRSMQHHLV